MRDMREILRKVKKAEAKLPPPPDPAFVARVERVARRIVDKREEEGKPPLSEEELRDRAERIAAYLKVKEEEVRHPPPKFDK